MKASELIDKLQTYIALTGTDPEVLAQARNCCRHGHPIESVDLGKEVDNDGVETPDEVGKVVIRV